jgi:hypothetical protein
MEVRRLSRSCGAAGAGPEDAEDTEEALSILGIKRLDMPPPSSFWCCRGMFERGALRGREGSSVRFMGFEKGKSVVRDALFWSSEHPDG